MDRSIDKVLPEAVSEAVKDAFEAKLKSKMNTACRLLVRVVRIVEDLYGPQAREQIRRELREQPRQQRGEGDAGALRAFCAALEEGCAGSHEWQKVEETNENVSYEFSRCMWAEIFDELDATDIGIWFCDGDEPTAQSWGLNFQRSKTLMEGDEVCDHKFSTGGKDYHK